jgi:hypothetical protein
MSSSLPSGKITPPDPVWARLSAALLRANSDFSESSRHPSNARPLLDTPLVGSGFGRTWEVRFHRPRFLAPDRVVGVTTGIRWDEPQNMGLDSIPWLYIGARPRALTRSNLELDRIIMRYKRTEGNLRGVTTGDPNFDRRWAVYPSRPAVGAVMQDAAARKWLSDLADLRPRPGDDLPAIAAFGTTVVLSVVVDSSDRSEEVTAALPRSFGRFLDEVEISVSERPASAQALTMDLIPDELGYPVPTLRFRCPACGEETHPRYQSNLETEVCDRCGKSLYRYP